MKKSEMFREAAKAVVLADYISTSDKLEILKVLFHEEELELYREKNEGESAS